MTSTSRPNLDTRLKVEILYDAKLQKRLSGDEFRSFVNVLVYSVTLASDGVFDAGNTEMFADPEHIEKLTKLGILDVCEDTGMHRIAPAYFDWQTSKAELDRMAEVRQKDAERKRKSRQEKSTAETRSDPPEADESPWVAITDMEPIAPF